MSLLVLCPSKGRPEKAFELLETFRKTKVLDSTQLIFVLDEGEPGRYPGSRMYVEPSGRRGMVDPINAALEAMRQDGTLDEINATWFSG